MQIFDRREPILPYERSGRTDMFGLQFLGGFDILFPL